jgi:uncharacterized protein (TIGR03437 family)
VDILLANGGIDGSISVQVFGKGVSLHSPAVKVDSRITYGGQPVVRVTLDLAKYSTPALASMFITKGTSTLFISGEFVIVPPKPTFTSASFVNAASYLKASDGSPVVSPGGIYSIYADATNSLGPAALVSGVIDAYGNLATSLGGVTVTFDGVPAPLFLSYAGLLNVQVPFEVAGKTSTKVVVNYLGSLSDAVTVPVTAAQPGFFTVTPAKADSIVQNFPDYSLNAAANALVRGGIALIYGTAIGKLPYALATGQPGVAPPSSYASTYSCSFGGKSAPAYAYWNYGFVGMAIWVATVPADAPTGSVALTCTDSVTGASTQPGTIYLK